MDYRSYLSPEIRDFITETEAFYPPDLEPDDWTAQRDVYDRMAAHFHAGRPDGLTVTNSIFSGVNVRIYGHETATRVLYAHGGGFVLGDLDSHDDVCAEIAARTSMQVVSVDYRLSPEHRHPAAYDDVLAVARVLAGQGRLILCGDSAGATLCAAISGTNPDLPLAGQVLIYPMLGFAPVGGSFEVHADAPLLKAVDLGFYAAVRGGDPDDPRATPAMGDLAHLPKTWVFPAECDPLCDDALRYARAAPDTVKVTVQNGLVHGWLRARGRSDMTRHAFSQIIAAIDSLGA